MLRDEGVALIQEQLSFRTTLSSSIIRYMQLAQTTLEKGPTKPWFLVSEDTFTDTVVDEQRISLPVNFLQEVEGAAFKYRPADYPDEPEVELIKEEFDKLSAIYKDIEAGPPEAYALLGRYFQIFPIPDDVYNLRLIFFRADEVLTSNIENGWLREIPLLLLGTAGQMMASPIAQPNAYKVFSEWITAGLKVLHGHDTSRDMANREMQIGGRHY